MLFIIIAIILDVCGVILFLNRGSSILISGYNTLPKVEQKKYNTNRLCRWSAFTYILCSAAFLGMGTASVFHFYETIAFAIGVPVVVICAIIYVAGFYIKKDYFLLPEYREPNT